ncbi:hypothetical protein T07_5593, partial [Trichinella nelsoni]
LKERMSIWLQWSNKCDLWFHIFMLTNPMQGESMVMHKVRIISLSPKAVSTIWHEETECSGIRHPCQDRRGNFQVSK